MNTPKTPPFLRVDSEGANQKHPYVGVVDVRDVAEVRAGRVGVNCYGWHTLLILMHDRGGVSW